MELTTYLVYDYLLVVGAMLQFTTQLGNAFAGNLLPAIKCQFISTPIATYTSLARVMHPRYETSMFTLLPTYHKTSPRKVKHSSFQAPRKLNAHIVIIITTSGSKRVGRKDKFSNFITRTILRNLERFNRIFYAIFCLLGKGGYGEVRKFFLPYILR